MTFRLANLKFQPTDLRGAANSAAAWIAQLSAIHGTMALGVSDALAVFIKAYDALQAAKGKAALIATDPSLVVAAKLERIHALMDPAFDAVKSAVEGIASAMSQTQAQIEHAILPKKPSAADSALMAFTAEQLAATLEAAGDGIAVLNRAVKLLQNALQSGDTVQVYLLAGGPLNLLYERKGVIMAALAQRFAEALAAQDGQQSPDGVELLAALKVGGSGTLGGLVAGARYGAMSEQQAYNNWLLQSARLGQMNGVYDTGNAGQRAAGA